MTQLNGILLTGSQGTTGLQGISGSVGNAGIQGVQGSQSTQGIQGVQAVKGIQGMANILPTFTGKLISPAFLCGQNIQLTLTSNRLYAMAFLPSKDINYSAISCYVTLAGVAGNVGKFGIYDDSNGTPNNLLYQSADVDLSTTGIKLVSTSGTLLAGKTYWLCFVQNAGSTNFNAMYNYTTSPFRYSSTTPLFCVYKTITYGSLPNPFGTANPTTGNIILIALTLS